MAPPTTKDLESPVRPLAEKEYRKILAILKPLVQRRSLTIEQLREAFARTQALPAGRAALQGLASLPRQGTSAHTPAVLAALKRGKQIRDELLQAEGGSVTARKFAPLIGVSHVTVMNRRNKGELLAVAQEDGSFLFPVWQISGGRIIEGLAKVMRVLTEAGAKDIAIIGFFLEAQDALEEQRPLDVLRAGDVDRVLEAVSTWGRHGGR